MTTQDMVAALAKKNGSTPHPPPLMSTPPKFVASQLLDISSIEPDPHNPRKDFPKDAMNELISSVMMFGVRQPIEVRLVAGGKHRIVFGERRFRAATAAGLKQIPAIVRQLSDLDAAEVQLDENLKRSELSPLEVAGGYQRQLELGRTIDQVCERAGKKRSAVYAMVQLLQLGEPGRKALGEEKISTSVAQLVARVPKALQEKALSLVLPGSNFPAATFREAEKALADSFTVDLKRAPFDTKDAKLCPSAGTCAACPKRSGNAPDLFPELKSPDVCTDRPCYDAKVHADVKRVMDAKGYRLLSQKEAPPDETFWNGDGSLKDDSYVDPDSVNYDDAQNRKNRELLPLEHFKKLAVVVIDGHGKARQLLPKAGLARELKKAGVFKEKTKRQASAAAPTKPSKPAEYKPPPPTLEELTDKAVLAACVAAVEKNPAKLAVLKLIAIEAVATTNTLYERRGLKDLGYGRLSVKEFDKTFGKLSFNKLVALIFDALFDHRYSDGDPLDDVTAVLGVNAKKVEATVKAEQDAKAAKAASGDKAAEKAKKADAKKATPAHKRVTFSNGKHHLSAKADPLDSPAVAKAKAKKAAKKVKKALAKKGGGK